MEAFVGWEVLDFDSQQVVKVASYVVALDDLGRLTNVVLESADVLALVSNQPDTDERREAMAVDLWVDDRSVSADDAAVFQSSKAREHADADSPVVAASSVTLARPCSRRALMISRSASSTVCTRQSLASLETKVQF